MKIAVLFDGAGLARLGLEQAGHKCTGVELDPWKVHLGLLVGSGNVIQGDATKFNLCDFDAVWASPPCARRTSCIKDLTHADGLRNPEFQHDYLKWCIQAVECYQGKIWWIENVTQQGANQSDNAYNAAQFLREPIQCRNRIILGNHGAPKVFRRYLRHYPDLNLCPTITATEYKASGATDRCRASLWYKRNLTVEECAFHQGFKIPRKWFDVPEKFESHLKEEYRVSRWRKRLYEAIGDGVPVYMARSFGEVYRGR